MDLSRYYLTICEILISCNPNDVRIALILRDPAQKYWQPSQLTAVKKKKKSPDKGAHYLYDCDKLRVSVCDGI